MISRCVFNISQTQLATVFNNTYCWEFEDLHYYLKGFLGGSDNKESACYAGDLGSIPGSGRSPGGGHGNPLQYSCLKNPHGQSRLAGYSPWGHKESDMHLRIYTII